LLKFCQYSISAVINIERDIFYIADIGGNYRQFILPSFQGEKEKPLLNVKSCSTATEYDPLCFFKAALMRCLTDLFPVIS
jgi:hypothetical protein